MTPRFLCLRLLGCRLLAACLFLISQRVEADEYPPYATVGTQMLGMTVGPMIPIRLLPTQSSKLSGEVVIPSWSMTLTEPVGSGWYQGQLALGAELPTFRTDQPVTAYGVGIAPKLVYTLITYWRARPFVEGGGGPLWTNLGGRVPEEPGQFNFLVWGGAGCSYSVTSQWSVNAGFRFVHISNAGTRSPNSGLNFGLPFIGFSYALF